MIKYQTGLLLCLSILLLQAFCPVESFGDQCLQNYKKGKGDFVVDINGSVRAGATLIASPTVQNSSDCLISCCKTPHCNLASIEGSEKGSIKACYLFDCMYLQKNVCRFVKRERFNIYILNPVLKNLIGGRQTNPGDEDKHPIADAGADKVIQPMGMLLLDGIESWDDKKIVSYQWKQLQGNSSVIIKKTDLEDQVKVLNISAGVYVFQLTVTDSGGHSDTANVTVFVLTPEQSENRCLANKKVGPCRGSFHRWHYNGTTGMCEKFVYGGCKRNWNNFLSLEECQSSCVGVSDISAPGGRKFPTSALEVEVCNSPCEEEHFRCANGCCLDKHLECDEKPQCSDGSDEDSCNNLNKTFSHLLEIPVNEQLVRCTEPPQTGHCRAHLTHWFYDPLERKCAQFTYGGCGGNQNNFESEDLCMESCKSVTETDVFLQGVFERLEDKESHPGLVIGVLVGLAGLVLLAVLGFCYHKGRKQPVQHQRVAVTAPEVPTPLEDTETLVYNSTTKPI